MPDSDTQAKLRKLARMEEKARERSRKYLERAKQDGKKQLSAIISGNTYNELNRLRDAAQLVGKPTSFGQIIDKAVACYVDSLKPIDKPIIEIQTEIPAPMPDRAANDNRKKK